MKEGGSYSSGAAEAAELTPEEFRRAGHDLVDWISNYLAHPERYPVLSRTRPGELLDTLTPDPPGRPSPQAAILADFEREILPRAVHWNHPGFMAYFAAGGSSPGILGETLAAALNNVGLLWRSSPALAELEEGTLRWLARLLGLPGYWFGWIHDTASTATLHAVIASRQLASERARRSGSELDLNRIVIYTSAQAHSSVERAMAVLGRGFDACRKIPCDDRFAMRPEALRHAIAADLRKGFEPIAVVATVGTTASAGVDPVGALAEIAAEHSVWLHVDAAYAGPAAMLPELREHFAGCERADSYVVNPHKWLFVPMDCSVMYTSRPDSFRRALSLVPEYLNSGDHPRAVNYMEYSIPLGRRFRALKLWYVLRSFGSERITATLREHVRLAGLLAEWVDAAPDFERMAPTHFSLVCLRFVPPGVAEAEIDRANEKLLVAVNDTGEFFLSHARLADRYVIRVAIGNIRTTEEHVRRLWELLQRCARIDLAP